MHSPICPQNNLSRVTISSRRARRDQKSHLVKRLDYLQDLALVPVPCGRLTQDQHPTLGGEQSTSSKENQKEADLEKCVVLMPDEASAITSPGTAHLPYSMTLLH